MAGTRILLVDNGSYEPAATLALRGLAQEVGKLIGQPVLPVSTMHSTKIDPALLGGVPAVIFEGAVQQAKLDGIDELVVLPLFIGPSRAITEYLPKVFADAQPGEMKLSIREPLFGPELVTMLSDNLKSTGWTKGSGTVFLCDHGSPIPEVTRCRNFFAVSLSNQLGLKEDELIACSMERREGAEYDFNEPLLEDALQQAKGEAIILMLFLLPGRHAGGDGDVATIAKEHAPEGLRWKLSPLLGTHPALPALLFRRHLHSPNFKTTKIAAITALLATGLLPVLGSIPAPKDQGTGASLMIWLGAFAVIFTVLFLFLRAKAWKKS
ncbi:MAG: cobalamin biosynthesis protein CbiX [Opitutia bacterium]|nr:MAG: cobalamin biosynthesis protein CbiX [Opitutae bacterium]